MGRKRTTLDQKTIDRYKKEGRGQGRGSEYKPWINIHSFSSQGIVSRLYGYKTGRMHSFMSHLEKNYYYLLWWSDKVVDIREQYPLLDIDIALKIAEDFQINYPFDRQTGTPRILTTDFMITLKINGKEIDIARTVKPAKELDKKRVIEKFEIEKLYWEEKGVNWGIVTDKEIPEEMVSNLEWFYSAYVLEKQDNMEIDDLKYIASILKERIQEIDSPIRKITEEIDKEFKLKPGISLYLLKHVIARKLLPVNIREKIELTEPIKLIQL